MGSVPTRSPSPSTLHTSRRSASRLDPTPREKRSGGGGFLVLGIPWVWLLLFLLLPAAIVLKIALSEPADGVPPYAPLLHWAGGIPHLSATTDNFALILTDPLYRGAFLHSL